MTAKRLAALLVLASGACQAPPAPDLPTRQPRPLVGSWRLEGGRTFIHEGAGEGILLLVEAVPIQLELRIDPGPGAGAAGVLFGYEGPSRTQAMVVEAAGGLAYLRREGERELRPPAAAAALPPGAFAAGFRLVVAAWPEALLATLPGLGPTVTWHPLVRTAGSLGLLARGPVRFRLEAAGAPPPAPPVQDGRRLARLALPRGPRPAAHLGGPLEAAQEALDAGSAAEELAAAWLWTGREERRDQAQAALERALRAPPPRPAPLLRDLAAAGHLLGEEGRARLVRAAQALAAAQAADGTWPPGPAEPAAGLLEPGRALLNTLHRVQGPEAAALHQAHRRALNRLVEAVQPAAGDFKEAGSWRTGELLHAAAWLAEAAQVRSDAPRLLLALETWLEERRLILHEGRLRLVERDGSPLPGGGWLYALHLARLSRLAGLPAWGRAAEDLARQEAAGREAAPFLVLRDLVLALPHLAPPGTLAIGATTTAVDLLHRDGPLLLWRTAGPSRETVVSRVSGLALKVDGEERPAAGPLLDVAHKEPEVRLEPAANAGGR